MDTENKPHYPIQVLLVEDSPEDIELTQTAMERNYHEFNIHIVTDGIKALQFLRKISGYEGVPTPDLIMLDLNLPKKDGREVLAEIKMDQKLRQIPVVVLTTSTSEQDIQACYNDHANCYVTKPVDLDHFFEVARQIEQFWFQTARLPKNHE
ncbi:MAG: response regulator [Flavobacteriales bacterium]|nr:response regulator [Flavobacteriales bacterium]